MVTEEQIQKTFDMAIKDCCKELKVDYLSILNFTSKEKFISFIKNVQSVKSILSTGVFKNFTKQCPYFIYRHDNLIDRLQTKLTNRVHISIQIDVLNEVYKDFPPKDVLQCVRQNIIYELACREHNVETAKRISEKYVNKNVVKLINRKVWSNIFLDKTE